MHVHVHVIVHEIVHVHAHVHVHVHVHVHTCSMSRSKRTPRASIMLHAAVSSERSDTSIARTPPPSSRFHSSQVASCAAGEVSK